MLVPKSTACTFPLTWPLNANHFYPTCCSTRGNPALCASPGGKAGCQTPQMGPCCTFWANGGDFNAAFDWTGLSPGWATWNPALAETLKCRAESSAVPGSVGASDPGHISCPLTSRSHSLVWSQRMSPGRPASGKSEEGFQPSGWQRQVIRRKSSFLVGPEVLPTLSLSHSLPQSLVLLEYLTFFLLFNVFIDS